MLSKIFKTSKRKTRSIVDEYEVVERGNYDYESGTPKVLITGTQKTVKISSI